VKVSAAQLDRLDEVSHRAGLRRSVDVELDVLAPPHPALLHSTHRPDWRSRGRVSGVLVETAPPRRGDESGMTEKIATTDGGAPVPSVEHSLTVGPDGPILLNDHYLIEQMANFNRERIRSI
jgi:hypothetical protein